MSRSASRLSLVALFMIGRLFGEPAVVTSLSEQVTPPAVAPGSPTGSYPLSGFDTINPFSGGLGFALPLHKVKGRGDLSHTVMLTMDTKWQVMRHRVADGTVNKFVAHGSWASILPGYGPGVVLGRIAAETTACTTGDSLVTFAVVTHITFVGPDLTEHELKDVRTNGAPINVVGALSQSYPCGVPVAPADRSRGTVFESSDDGGMTFVSNSEIFDTVLTFNSNATENSLPDFPVTGTLYFKNGTSYRINSGRVERMQDRNGNEMTFTYDASNRVTSISDGRGTANNVTIQYGVVSDDCGAGVTCDTITYPGSRLSPATETIWIVKGTRDLGMTGDLFADMYLTVSQSIAIPVATVVRLPNSMLYSFQYNDYGELAQVTLPTGGYIQYSYVSGLAGSTSGGGDTLVLRRTSDRRVYLATGELQRHEAFSTPVESDSNGTNNQTDGLIAGYRTSTATTEHYRGEATSPELTETHYFHGAPSNSLAQVAISQDHWKEGREYQTVTTGGGRTKIVKQLWSGRQAPIAWTLNSTLSANSDHPRVCQTNTRIDSGSEASELKFFDSFENITDSYVLEYASPQTFPTVCPTSPSAGFIRHDHTVFESTPDWTATPVHLRSLPLSQEVSVPASGSGEVIQSHTDYIYDCYDSLACTVASDETVEPLAGATATGHDDSGHGGDFRFRGNVWRQQRWVAGSDYAKTYGYYDILGNLVKRRDPNKNLSTITFGACQSSFATGVTDALNDTTTFGYHCGTGLMTQSTDRNSQTTSYTYNDPLSRLTKVTYPDGGYSSFTYDDVNLTITTTTAQHTTTQRNTCGIVVSDDRVQEDAFDSLGRSNRTSVKGGTAAASFWSVTTKAYDEFDRVHQVFGPYKSTEAQPQPTTTEYNAFGEVTKTTFPDGAVSLAAYSGRAVTTRDPANKWKKTSTDALGRLISVVEDPTASIIPADGNTVSNSGADLTTTYSYNALGSLLTVTQGTQSRQFTYDGLGRLHTSTQPELGNQAVTYAYDMNGNLTTKSDSRGDVQWVYDVANRPTSKTYVIGTASTVASISCYDGKTLTLGSLSCAGDRVAGLKGRLTAVGNGSSVTAYGDYDSMGRVLSTKQDTDGQGFAAKTYTYGYGLAGQMIVFQAGADGRSVTTCHDIAGRPWKVFSGSKQYGVASYGASGEITALSLKGGAISKSIGYDSMVRPTALAVDMDGYRPLELGFTHSGTPASNGNMSTQRIIAKSKVVTGGIPTVVTVLDVTQSYQYDKLNRLSTAAEPAYAGNDGWSQAYLYDRWGNRAVNNGSQYYQPSADLTPQAADESQLATLFVNNQWIFGSNGDHYQAGNQIQLPGGRSMEYDLEGRLTSFALNGATTTFVYDGEGRRVQKRSASTATYVYDALGQLYAEYAGTPASAGTEYVIDDHLGSTRLVVPEVGSLRRRDYLPFGEDLTAGKNGRSSEYALNGSDGSTLDRVRFTGKERDAETGLDYFGARYFAGAQGRFTSPDVPLLDQHPSDPQSWNLYAYARNNPLRFIDPTGHAPGDASDACGGGSIICTKTTVGAPLRPSTQNRAAADKNPARVVVDRVTPPPGGGDMARGGDVTYVLVKAPDDKTEYRIIQAETNVSRAPGGKEFGPGTSFDRSQPDTFGDRLYPNVVGQPNANSIQTFYIAPIDGNGQVTGAPAPVNIRDSTGKDFYSLGVYMTSDRKVFINGQRIDSPTFEPPKRDK